MLSALGRDYMVKFEAIGYLAISLESKRVHVDLTEMMKSGPN